MRSKEAFDRLLKNFNFKTVLDIGSGDGEHSRAFADAEKNVTSIDLGVSIHQRDFKADPRVRVMYGNFNYIRFDERFDCIWASHILEHQPNPGMFLQRVFAFLKDDGVFVVTVPMLKHEIVGGHVTLWNAGLLVYQLVLARFDCSQAMVGRYRGEISVIVKKTQPYVDADILDGLHMDDGDVKRLSIYFPEPVEDGFDGAIYGHKWDV